jgi:hypothetical protein
MKSVFFARPFFVYADSRPPQQKAEAANFIVDDVSMGGGAAPCDHGVQVEAS